MQVESPLVNAKSIVTTIPTHLILRIGAVYILTLFDKRSLKRQTSGTIDLVLFETLRISTDA